MSSPNQNSSSLPPQNQEQCQCLVYKDSLFITAQALSIVAFCLSWGFWLTGLFGLASMIMLQVAWCCRMPRCGLITAGVFACIDAFGCLIVAIAMFVLANHKDTEDVYLSNAGNVWGIYCLIGTALWVGVAICTFRFTRRRLPALERQEQQAMEQQDVKMVTNNKGDTREPPLAVAEPVADSSADKDNTENTADNSQKENDDIEMGGTAGGDAAAKSSGTKDGK